MENIEFNNFNNKVEQEVQGEIERMREEIQKSKSLIDSIKEKFPSLQKIYESGKTTLQVLVALVMMGVGQNIFAQEDLKQKEDQFWSFQNLEKLKTENLTTIYNKIPSAEMFIPEWRKVFGSYTLSGSSKNKPQRVIVGEIPDSVGIIGDLIVHTDSKIVVKKEEKNGQSSVADTASFFVEVAKAEKEDILYKKTEKKVVSTIDRTRKEALFSAIKSIGESGIRSVKNMQLVEEKQGEKNLTSNFISISSISGLNYVQDVRIVSEKKLPDGSYEITVEGNVIYNDTK